MAARRQGFLEAFEDVLHRDDGFHLQEGAQHHHIVGFRVAHLGRFFHRVDATDGDVSAFRVARDAIGVVQEQSARLDLFLKLVHRLLVEDDGRVETAQDGRADLVVAQHDAHVAGAAAHFRAVGGEPGDFLVLHDAAVGEDLAHREDALSSESGYDDFFFHNVRWVYLSFMSPSG